jgi:hypothetical protein
LAASDDVDWEYTWSPYYDAEACDNVAWVDITEDEDETETGGATSETQTVTSGEENDGVTTLTATATATAGWSGSLAENSTLSTFYCNEDEVWQYVDQVGGESYVSHSYPQNFRLIYCDTDDLPTLNAPVVTEGSGADDWFLQYLFYNASDEDQAFSIRVYENADNLTPEEWYNQNVPNPSSPSELTVDGYQAVRDGLSYYVAASNIGDDTDGDGLDELYSNIYLITFNDEDTLLQIADQLMDYIRFNWNVSYAECDGSDKDKLTRDTKRVADLRSIQVALELYWNENAGYPLLVSSGTDTWAELSTDLSAFMSALPVDPQDADAVDYVYIMDPSTSNKYYLQATLENTSHQGLSQDVDGAAGTSGATIPGATGWRSLTSNDAFDDTDATVDCADGSGHYCLKGDATN